MGDDDGFVKQFEPLVRAIARQSIVQLGLRCDVDDLIGFGFTGLLEAKSRYDPTKGVPFKTFAHYRIRGAVIDGVRKMAYLPRRAHARMRVAEALDNEGQTLAEQRAAQAATPSGTNALQTAGAGERRASAARALDGVLGRIAAAYCVAANADEDTPGVDRQTPEARVAQQQRLQHLRAAIGLLPERERFLVEGYYLQERPLDELSAELGLSKSWGSRLHARALERLRQALRQKD